MKNVLLTGSNGFLGKIIINVLDREVKITTLSRKSGDYQICLSKEIPVFKNEFDLVIHAAGKAHSIPKAEIEEKEFYEINVTGTENLLKGFEKSTKPKEFIFVSSVSVYGQNIGNMIDEDHPLQAIDPYGLSKIEAEKFVINWCKKNNVICTILRLPLLVGKDAPGNLGAMVEAIVKGYYFNIGKGEARKSMVLGKDVASLIMKVSTVGGIYNLTDGFHPSFNELSVAISRNKNKKEPLNLPIGLVRIIGKLGDYLGDKFPVNSLKVKKMVSDLTFDDTKARVVLDWNPQSVVEYINNNKI
ncbi:NAD-dependent epimerase/dehydratase family protein [Flavobacterium limnophilum]|uniref:NAD-dependent epimerase/dehydratase family protein n=1 Tax=Flavobacterium limnophilum TaxID=3003262 RepID=UPI0022AC55DF|nr:NAD-dependent epimerase/dehydratase family protein [Flavobacterium limnophilum]